MKAKKKLNWKSAMTVLLFYLCDGRRICFDSKSYDMFGVPRKFMKKIFKEG